MAVAAFKEIMPKKYLLYIYNPLFDKEKKKSGLVNRLLDAYYKHKNKKVL